MLGLLDALRERAGCQYLSDLTWCWRERLTCEDLRALPADAYSVQEWNDAFQYLTGERAAFAAAKEARDALLDAFACARG